MRVLLLLSILALAACAPDRPERQTNSTDTFGEPETVRNETSAAINDTLIPARYLGIFDQDAETCDQPASDTRLAIEPAQLRFADGNARVQTVTGTTDGPITVSATRGAARESYTLTLDGAALGIASGGAATPYVRCTATAASSTRPLVNLADEGLSIVDPRSGSARMLAFGIPRAEILRILGLARGASTKQGDLDDCGEGPLAFANFAGGLVTFYQDGKFTGWSLEHGGDRALATASGLTLGSTRKSLQDAYDASIEESSLGTEFSAGDLSGLLDGDGPDARVTSLWAGTTCVAR